MAWFKAPIGGSMTTPMARTEKLVNARVETVFAVLCDPSSYQHFVVGTKRVRRFDPHWPKPGTALHHTVGVGPLALRDKTDATEAIPPTHLVTRPHTRPFVIAESRFELEPRGGSTLLRLDEYAVGGPLRPIWPGPLDWLVALRNRTVVDRIARLAEQRANLQHLG
jgi:hypothetical protein